MSNSALKLHSKDKIESGVCETTKKHFTKLLLEKDIASNTDLFKLEYAKPINTHYKEYNRGIRGKKSNARYKLFEEAAKLKNAKSYVLSYYWSLYKMGYTGTIATHFTNGDVLSDAMNCRCGERTFRNAIKELDGVWLKKEYVYTGKKNKTGTDKKGNDVYSMLQVCSISITEKSILLFTDKKQRDKSKPRKNFPLAYAEATPQPSPPSGGRAEGQNIPINKKVSSKTSGTSRKSKEVLTRPSAPSASTTVEHKTIKKTRPPACNRSLKKEIKSKMERKENLTSVESPAVFAEKPAVASVSGGSLSVLDIRKRGKSYGRLTRNRAQSDYLRNRKLFLLAVLKFSKSQQLHDIAGIQTHLNYPPLAPTSGNWDLLIYDWPYLDEKQQSEKILREIIPSLREFEHCFNPPNPFVLKAGEHHPQNDIEQAKKRKYENLRAKFNNIDSYILDRYLEVYETQEIEEDLYFQIKDYAFTLNHLPWSLLTGNRTMDNCTEEELEIFSRFAQVILEDK